MSHVFIFLRDFFARFNEIVVDNTAPHIFRDVTHVKY